MAIAITPFDGLCGFRPLAEISHFLQHVEPLRQIVGESAAKDFVDTVKGRETASDEESMKENKKALQTAFSALMENATSDSDKLKKAASALVDEAKKANDDFAASGGPGPNGGKELAELIVRLDSQFPQDVGLFVVFFVNYVKLKVGEAMFLKADDIHAYLSGDIMECMASSDNVVRAGFTPKFKDVGVLSDMLTYSYAPISEQKMEPVDYPYVTLDRTAYSAGSSAILYDPPIDEFSVVKTDLKKQGAKATFEAIQGPSIVICTSGNGKIRVGNKSEEMQTGYVYFVGATAELVLEAGSEDFVTFKAFCELHGKESASRNGNL